MQSPISAMHFVSYEKHGSTEYAVCILQTYLICWDFALLPYVFSKRIWLHWVLAYSLMYFPNVFICTSQENGIDSYVIYWTKVIDRMEVKYLYFFCAIAKKNLFWVLAQNPKQNFGTSLFCVFNILTIMLFIFMNNF